MNLIEPKHGCSKAHRVVIVGGGFGGLSAAQTLGRAGIEVKLIDRRNFHLFQPLLYQVATGALSPANISAPLRSILQKQSNVEPMLGEVVAIDPDQQRVILADGSLSYDSLILAAGARHHYFGNLQFERKAPGLKTIEDATDIRRRILTAFEAAARHQSEAAISAWLTFVVVGGGPTGVELAGAIGELAHQTLRREFRQIDTGMARIILVEGRERVLPTYPPSLSERAERSLSRLGVTIRSATMLDEIGENEVRLKTGDHIETVAARNVFWAAGVQASPLGILVARATAAEVDRAGRLIVEPDCSLPGYPNIFVIGDLAHYGHHGEEPLPGLAPVAMKQGKFVAQCIHNRIVGKPVGRFQYKDRGQMAMVGRASAVVDMGRLRYGGFVGWLTWLFIHLILLVGFENRLLALVQWGWNYLTRNRSARLITHGDAILVERESSKEEMGADSPASTSGFFMHGESTTER